MKSKLFSIAAAVVSLCILAWIVYRSQPAHWLPLIRQSNSLGLALAAIAVACLPPLMAWRWNCILRSQGFRLPFIGLVRAVMLANLWNTVLPGKAGDVTKALYIRKQTGLMRGLGGVLLERMVDIAILGALGLIGYAATGVTWGLAAGALLLGGSLGAMAGMAFLPLERWLPGKKLPQMVSDFRSAWSLWIRQPKWAAQTFLASLFVWLLCASVLALLILSFHQPLPWPQAYAILPLAVLAGMVPLTVGGLGTREAVMVWLMVPPCAWEGAGLVSLGYTVLTYWFLASLAFPWFVTGGFRDSAKVESSPAT